MWRKELWYAIGFCCSVTKSCPTLCDPMDCSTPGFPVYHQLLELAQTPVHWVGDAIQPSHSLLPPSPPVFNLSRHQGSLPMSQFFASGGQRIGASASASVLPINYQGWFPLGLTGLITCYPRDSQESSPLPQFKSISILRHSASFTIQHSHPYMTTGKIIALIIWTFFSKVVWLLF